MTTLVKNATVVTMNPSRAIIPDGYVVIEDGQIALVGQGCLPSEEGFEEVIGCEEGLLIPGLVNAHTHSSSNLLKFTVENLPLELWAMYVIAGELLTGPHEAAVSASLGYIELVKSGTTCFLDHLPLPQAGDIHEALSEVARVYDGAGARVVLAPLFSNKSYLNTLPRYSSAQGRGRRPGSRSGSAVYAEQATDHVQILQAVERLAETWHRPGGRLTLAVAPSGPQRCTDKMLEMCREVADRRDLVVHTHLLETKTQFEALAQMYGCCACAKLAKMGLMTPRTSLAHCVWLCDEDIEVIARTGAHVVHNPASNLILGSGLMPLDRLRKAGVNVALGTDGADCGGRQSMFESMKLALGLNRLSGFSYTTWIRAEDAFEMATLGGARALGLLDSVGSIEVGKRADLVIMTPSSTSLVPLVDPYRQLVCCENGSSVRSVLVDGRVIVRDGAVETLDQQAVMAKARHAWGDLRERLDREFAGLDEARDEVDRIYRSATSAMRRPIPGLGEPPRLGKDGDIADKEGGRACKP